MQRTLKFYLKESSCKFLFQWNYGQFELNSCSIIKPVNGITQ